MYIIMGNKSPISTSETRIVKGSKCQRCLRTRVNDVSGLYTEGVWIVIASLFCDAISQGTRSELKMLRKSGFMT